MQLHKNLAVNVKHLKKSLADLKAVRDISLQVNYGEIFGFVGPNGSGKTTTIRMLCGLLTPDEGQGECLGYDILTQSREIKRHIGYIPQFFGLYKQLTAKENLSFIAELYGVTNRTSKINNMLDRFGLTKVKDQLSGTLSGGWKQRLSLAAALIHDPMMLLLDEPTASVDPNSRRDFWEIMHTLSKEGLTILLSSHNIDEVERCNRIAYVTEGKVLMSGAIKSFIQNVNLTTWYVRGKNLVLLAKQLEALPYVDQVVTFFDEIHVSSQDEEGMLQSIVPYLKNSNYEWQLGKTTLEDVFVWLSRKRLHVKDA